MEKGYHSNRKNIVVIPPRYKSTGLPFDECCEIMKYDGLKISSIIPISEANGPGPHYAIWLQGCSLRCSGCFNPHTHDPNQGYFVKISTLLREIKMNWEERNIRGVTLTGGEPLDQIYGVIKLVNKIKKIGNIGIILLTGYGEEKLRRLPEFFLLKRTADVIIAGRFMQSQKIQKGIRGSRNKKILFFSNYYTIEEFEDIPPVEVWMKNDGTITITGIEPEIIKNSLEAI
ncbi:MAG: 4Fe-4S cluster-binding domain-containing protein [Candidatus Hodarchaeales archaeon]|jgi:anaerobic ribonucleoside-triphosphate reductase activating protein